MHTEVAQHSQNCGKPSRKVPYRPPAPPQRFRAIGPDPDARIEAPGQLEHALPRAAVCCPTQHLAAALGVVLAPELGVQRPAKAKV